MVLNTAKPEWSRKPLQKQDSDLPKVHLGEFREQDGFLALPNSVVSKESIQTPATARYLGNSSKGGTQIRTGDKGFAILCLTTWPCRRSGSVNSTSGSYQRGFRFLAAHQQWSLGRPHRLEDHRGASDPTSATNAEGVAARWNRGKLPDRQGTRLDSTNWALRASSKRRF